jgi:hypothetical protein
MKRGSAAHRSLQAHQHSLTRTEICNVNQPIGPHGFQVRSLIVVIEGYPVAPVSVSPFLQCCVIKRAGTSQLPGQRKGLSFGRVEQEDVRTFHLARTFCIAMYLRTVASDTCPTVAM